MSAMDVSGKRSFAGHPNKVPRVTFGDFWRLSLLISVMVGLGAVRAAAGDYPALPAWYRTFEGRPGLMPPGQRRALLGFVAEAQAL